MNMGDRQWAALFIFLVICHIIMGFMLPKIYFYF
jgi:hypothetical protein